MSRAPARVTQADIARAIRAIKQTGERLAVKIDTDGAILILPVDSVRDDVPKVVRKKEFVL